MIIVLIHVMDHEIVIFQIAFSFKFFVAKQRISFLYLKYMDNSNEQKIVNNKQDEKLVIKFQIQKKY